MRYMHGWWYTKTLPKRAWMDHIAFQKKGVTTMIAFVLHFLEFVGAAQRVAEASRNRQVPSAKDLKILDLPASAFVR